jgi:tetratricopeptide (TPR) repeat protein
MSRRLLVVLLIGLTTMRSASAVVIEYGGGNQQLLGKVLKANEEYNRGEVDAAFRDVNEVLRSDPKFFPAYLVRAEIYLTRGKAQLAVEDCSAGLKVEPQFVDLAILRAIANSALHKYAESLKELDHVIALRSPRSSIMSWAFNQRAWLRATCPDAAFRDGKKALADAKRACSLTSNQESSYVDTLAAACAETGDFDSAIKYEQQAIKAGDTAYRRSHLASFQQRKPIREG